ncbi:hypothetical protein [Mumia quercus]|uniref:hypothetical protein n=1 Tax=Mumia quercus TaxID=2976125 RepID=UPI0021D18939|nr:hypothetical protein [Mumia quercus]
MGSSWVAVREGVSAGTLRATDKGAQTVVERFDALLRFTSLRLGRQLGTDVVPVISRKELGDPGLRSQRLLDELVTTSSFSGSIRIPNTVGPIDVRADLRAGRITCSVDIDAPGNGRPLTRVNWLVRQLKHAPDNTRVEVFAARSRGAGAAELLSMVREDPKLLVLDPARELKSFRVAVTAPMGAKRGRGRGSFIDSVLDLVDSFYGDVLQHLKAWSPAPPRLREAEPEQSALISTALSSQDGTQPVAPDRPAT